MQRSSVEKLPEPVKKWLDKALIEGNFSGYEALEEELRGRGFAISKSGIHRYGTKLQEKIDGVRKSTEMARILAAEVGDDEGVLNDALVRILQDKLFHLVMDLEVDPSKINVQSLSRSIADLARASISQKKYMAEVRAKSKAAAEDISKEVKKAGLSDEAANDIRKRILGIGE